MKNLTGHERALFGILELAANEGLRCPSNTDISRALNFGNFSHASDLMKRMDRKGVIKVRTVGNQRVVEIAASGKRTASPPPPKRHDEAKLAQVRTGKRAVPTVRNAYSEDLLAKATITEKRDPCVGCGVPYHRHLESGCKRWRGHL